MLISSFTLLFYIAIAFISQNLARLSQRSTYLSLKISIENIFNSQWKAYENLNDSLKYRINNKKNIAGQVLAYNSKKYHWLKRKLDLKRTMNKLGKPFRKKSDPKNRKNSKNQSEIAACEQKTLTEKPNFCSNTVFSLYFKIRAK